MAKDTLSSKSKLNGIRNGNLNVTKTIKAEKEKLSIEMISMERKSVTNSLDPSQGTGCQDKENGVGSGRPRAPDGGWGWVIVATSFIMIYFQTSVYIAFQTLYAPLVESLQTTKSAVGWIISICGFCSLAIGNFVGSGIIDRFGCRATGMVGALFSSMGLALSGLLPTNIYVLYCTYGIMHGIGSGFIFMPTGISIQRYFDKKRTLAQGLGLLGSSIALITSPPLTAFLIETFGWKGTFLIHSGFAMQNIVLSTLLKPVPKIYRSEESEQIKHQPLCKTLSDFSLLRKWNFTFVCIAGFFFQFQMAGNNHIISKAYLVTGDLQQASFVGTAFGVGNILARFLAMAIADRKFVKRPLYWALGFTLATGMFFVYAVSKSFTLLIVTNILNGIGMGSLVTVHGSAQVDLFGIANLPRAFGIQALPIGVAGLVATPFSGWLYDITHDYTITLLICGGIAVISIVLFLIVAVHFVVVTSRKSANTTDGKITAKNFPEVERQRTLTVNDEFDTEEHTHTILQEKRKRTFTITDGELYSSISSVNRG